VDDLTERDYLEDLGLDGRIILKRIFKKWDGRAWTGLVWHEGRCGWCAIGGDENSYTVRCGELVGFALRSCLVKAVLVMLVRHFHLPCKCFIFDTELPRQLSAICNFVKV
jgi:hypothetical protein